MMLAPTRRTVVVLVMLLGAMTAASALLLVLQGGVFNPEKLNRLSKPDLAERLFRSERPVDPAKWNTIEIHFSGQSFGSAESLDSLHYRAGLGGLSYHFVVNNGRGGDDGAIQLSQRWMRQRPGLDLKSESTPSEKPGAVSVCLIGDFERESPTEAQVRELVWLVNQLQRRLSIPAQAVRIEGSWRPDEPGRLFDESDLRRQLLSFASN